MEREDSVATGFRTGNPKPQSSTAVIVRYIVGWVLNRIGTTGPLIPTQRQALMAQWRRHLPTEQRIAGSSPAKRTVGWLFWYLPYSIMK